METGAQHKIVMTHAELLRALQLFYRRHISNVTIEKGNIHVEFRGDNSLGIPTRQRVHRLGCQ
jgi:hypothetical protein